MALSRAPQSPQNFWPAGFSYWQAGQRIPDLPGGGPRLAPTDQESQFWEAVRTGRPAGAKRHGQADGSVQAREFPARDLLAPDSRATAIAQ
jgi:hypothetical protein